MHAKLNWGRARVVLAMVFACGACTLIVDKTSTQCASDGDCAKFGSHPFCNNGVCVPSGLGPQTCFFATPQQPAQRQQDFFNQCSTAQCQPFDDCQKISVCDGGTPPLIPPPVPDAASKPSGTASDAAVTDAAVLPSCADPSVGRTQLLYMTGSSYFPPLLGKLAPIILSKSGYTPVYKVTNSCSGVRAILGTDSDHIMYDPPPGSSAPSAAYFKADGTAVPCSLGADGVQVDVGESDIFSSTCAGFGPPGIGVREYPGPVQSMVFVVPAKSKQTSISVAAAREVFGMGGNRGIAAPWTNPALYFIRNASTGTQQIIAHAIGVPASQFWGIDRLSPAQLDTKLSIIEDPAEADQAIGILASDTFDRDPSNLHALAFKAADQDCAYLPDSTEFKKDKQNVRDGHYAIWGPLHFYTAVSAGVPLSTGAQAFISAVVVPNLEEQLVDAFIASSLVPACAMNVQRTTELGPLSSYTPTFQCTCHFESQVTRATPIGCTPCKTSNDCNDNARPSCNLGFCEMQ